ncbi:unnamed protein product, partial [Polarella glacialis]
VCPPCVEVVPCPGKGNGLFAKEAFSEGDVLFEENPVCGTAILMFSEKERAAAHCAHCTVHLGTGAEAESCPRHCGLRYCSKECLGEAWWAHHAILCSAVNPAYVAYEEHARECSNEYYILAARALAGLRHKGDDSSALHSAPWSGYASPLWWETMRRPVYGGSSSSSSSQSDCEAQTTWGSCPASAKGSSDDGGGSSMDRFFQSTVQAQTAETASLLLAALEADIDGNSTDPKCRGHQLLQGVEGLGRLVGLLRVNALGVMASPSPGEEGQSEPEEAPKEGAGSSDGLVRGMAMYAVASAMNHDATPNCYVASDPYAPVRCIVKAMRPIALGEEISIDYLQSAPFSAKERQAILENQYGIPSELSCT